MINIELQEKYHIQQEILTKNFSNFNTHKSKISINTKETNYATKLELSNNVKSQLDSIVSQEDLLVENLNSARKTYESLANIRINLAELMQTLKETDANNIQELEELDNKSNQLIDSAINIVKNNQSGMPFNTNLMNLYFEGLSSFKTLKINDEEYLLKLRDILIDLRDRENSYHKLSMQIFSNIESLSQNYETEKNKQPIKNSLEIKSEIINNPQTTLTSVSQNLNFQKVSYLLN